MLQDISFDIKAGERVGIGEHPQDYADILGILMLHSRTHWFWEIHVDLGFTPLYLY